MSNCEGCGAPVKPALCACDYCRRDYPRAAAPAIDWGAYRQQQNTNAQQNCNHSGDPLSMLFNQQYNNPMLGIGGIQNQNPWGWPR